MEPVDRLGEEARRFLPDCSRIVLFDDRGGLLYSSCKVNPGYGTGDCCRSSLGVLLCVAHC